jgi:hypothetical protein
MKPTVMMKPMRIMKLSIAIPKIREHQAGDASKARFAAAGCPLSGCRDHISRRPPLTLPLRGSLPSPRSRGEGWGKVPFLRCRRAQLLPAWCPLSDQGQDDFTA